MGNAHDLCVVLTTESIESRGMGRKQRSRLLSCTRWGRCGMWQHVKLRCCMELHRWNKPYGLPSRSSNALLACHW